MNINIFHICSLLFSLVIMLSANSLFQDHFSQSKFLEKQLAYLIDDHERQQLELEMQEIEMLEFKQEVAKVLPHYNEHPKNYSGRQLASVVGGFTNINLGKTFSKILLRDAKKDFKNKKFDQAAVKLKKYIQQYPESSHLPESYLMLIEMEYSQANYEKTIEYINHLVSAYPANEITGHALFVLGDIMQKQERYEDASDLYNTIQEAFPLAQIKKKARKQLRSIGLE